MPPNGAKILLYAPLENKFRFLEKKFKKGVDKVCDLWYNYQCCRERVKTNQQNDN